MKQKYKKQLNKKNLKRLLIILGLAVIVGLFIGWANRPKDGSISNAPASKQPVTYSDQTLDGTYMQFKYSGHYMAHMENATNGDLERYTLTADTVYDKRILAAVSDLPNGNLGSMAAYIFRQKNPNLYSYDALQGSNGVISIWVRKDGTEETAMIPHGNKVAVITLVTANTADNLIAEMNTLLKSFKWKQ